MNNRIEELAEQAARDVRVQHSNAYWRLQDERVEDADWRKRFAELIVQECAKIVNDTEYPHEDTTHRLTWDTCCVYTAEKLKEKFGIK